ncbi:hypothetical protein CXB51_013997 [Gossypium anomalum]|uniref:Integrase catalytic domain-containing protein n=1 Tax=Gossypium anomalum TaxID=47600 RepID=A0A8J6D286_9ROSI|nr:hypothetical protein CXB51_013997 [Gossypium anomalum]
MSHPTSPSAAHSTTPAMTSSLTDGVLLAVKTYKLQWFLNTGTIPPSSLIPDANGVLHENPEFVRAQIWDAIVTLYGSKTTSRLMFFRRALHSQRKGNLSMREFLVKIKGFCANLASYGEVISDHEHVTAILNGLPPEYKSVVTIITASPVPYNAQGVTTMLLDAEARLQDLVSEVPSSANVVTHQPSDVPIPTPTYRPSFNTWGRGRTRSSTSQFQCQLCGKQGHLMDRCYYRFDASYKSAGYKPLPSSQANLSPLGWYFPPVPNWPNPFLVNSSTPISATPPATTHPQALITTLETVNDNAWYPDSGATHHLTHSASSMGDSSTYNGPGKVYVGNGNALPILSTGQYSLLTRTRPLYMRSLLFVPGITKNLLSNGLYKLHLHGTYPSVLSSGSAQCFAASSNKSFTEYTTPLQLIVAEVWGPAPIFSNGFRYYVAFTDAFTRYTWVYFFKKKSDVLVVFPLFHRQVERTLGCKLQALQTDGGGEFQVLKSYLSLQGIVHRLACPYTSVQNGIVDRKYRQIFESSLSMLAHAAMPLTYWHDVFSTAIYLINILPSHFLANISPYEKLFQVSPDYSYLRTFGCMCFPNLRPYNTHKLQFRSTPCTFLGYSPCHKGYCCQDVNGHVYVSRHVTFNEVVFPFQTVTSKSAPNQPIPQTSSKLFVLSPHLSFPPTSPCVLPPNPHVPSLANSCSPTQSSPSNSISWPSNTNLSISLPSSTSASHNSPPSPPSVVHNSHPMIT